MIITGRKIMEDTNRMEVKCRSCKKKISISIDDLTRDEENINYYKFSCPECESVSRKEIRSFKRSIQDALLNPHIINLEDLYTEEEPEEKVEYERNNEGKYVPIKKYDPYHMEVKCRICKRKLKVSAEDLTPDEDGIYYIFHCKACGANNRKHFTMLIRRIRERVIQNEEENESENEESLEEE